MGVCSITLACWRDICLMRNFDAAYSVTNILKDSLSSRPCDTVVFVGWYRIGRHLCNCRWGYFPNKPSTNASSIPHGLPIRNYGMRSVLFLICLQYANCVLALRKRDLVALSKMISGIVAYCMSQCEPKKRKKR